MGDFWSSCLYIKREPAGGRSLVMGDIRATIPFTAGVSAISTVMKGKGTQLASCPNPLLSHATAAMQSTLPATLHDRQPLAL